ncbi:DUF1206 domain-containing protein [Sphingomonas japonica]|uniref:DUF1206 domain-containing protein n=1 Tax=Sphingomonas japonica TaxID=511662 RepID=A0ABX0TWU3_9SPHN|nr:DUF1206 domain-containing protein [Sphingomonas japonica]NIJ22778.1 hypothetical protein [Sphingomonas japonica]
MPDIGKLEAMTRLGFAARGLLYCLIGYLAIRVGRTEDAAGALEFVESGAGRVLLVALAIGLLGYSIWRISEAFIDTEGHGSDAKGYAVRGGGVASGLFHLGLFFAACQLIVGIDPSDDSAVTGARTALEFPGGASALMLFAVILVGTGAYQAIKAVKLGFLRYLDPEAARMEWVRWAGRLGYLARGTVFVLMGYFLWQAGMAAQASEAGSMDKALDALPPTAQVVVAAGLFAFGIFSFVEARYRRITDQKVVERLKRLAPG